jgi:inorganic pyrophosphatase
VLAQAPLFVGCLVTVNLVGIVRAEQTESGKTIRNDRLLGAPVTTVNRPMYEHLDDVGPIRLADIEHFFVAYNAAHGRTFEPLGRGAPDDALKALRDAQQRYARRR